MQSNTFHSNLIQSNTIKIPRPKSYLNRNLKNKNQRLIDGSGGGGLSSVGNLVVAELGSEGGRVMVEMVRNIVVKVRRWRFVEEVSRLEVP